MKAKFSNILIGVLALLSSPILPAQTKYATPYTFTTFAGVLGNDRSAGNKDGPVSVARFNWTKGIAVDVSGNVYVADSQNATIRKITPDGVVTTLAGSSGITGYQDGTGNAARFSTILGGVAVDRQGTVYVSDGGNKTIRKITSTGTVTTLAGAPWNNVTAGDRTGDGTGTAATFFSPQGLAVDRDDNVYVADYSGPTIRKITPEGKVTTLAGLSGGSSARPRYFFNDHGLDGTGSEATFECPKGIAVDPSGDVYVSDQFTIRKITPDGVVTTLAGNPVFNLANTSCDGIGIGARFNKPEGLAVDDTNNVYVVDSGSNLVRKIAPGGIVTTLAGTWIGAVPPKNGTGKGASFWHPEYIAVDQSGKLYVADQNTVRVGVSSQ